MLCNGCLYIILYCECTEQAQIDHLQVHQSTVTMQNGTLIYALNLSALFCTTLKGSIVLYVCQSTSWKSSYKHNFVCVFEIAVYRFFVCLLICSVLFYLSRKSCRVIIYVDGGWGVWGGAQMSRNCGGSKLTFPKAWGPSQ